MNTTETTIDVNYLRSLINFANKQGEKPRTLFDYIKENDAELDEIIESVKNYFCDLDDILNGYTFSRDGYFYNQDNYVIADDTDNVIHIEDANYCQYDEVYIERDIVEVYISRRNTEYWSEYRADNCAYYYDGTYYSDLSDHDLVIMHDGGIRHIDDVYYWESDGEYHYEEEETEIYVNDYHHDPNTYSVNFTDSPRYFIGFEIEKEDKDVKESLYISDFNEACPNWKKERDGSLDDDSGFELISPKFELSPDNIRKHIESNKTLLNHVNAQKSTSCGGHINVSESEKSGAELFDEVKGYTPLFYALYHKRVDKNYCKGKKNSDLKEENDKYQAIKIHSNRIEFRIVSAVPNLNTLIWRARLIEFILNNKTDNVKEAFFKANTSPLKELLQEMYPDNYDVLINRLVKFTLQFENINVNEN
jgi:hypothetical protein